MSEMADRRRVARVTVPRHPGGPELELQLVRILDLSPLGARIEHPEPMREGVVCYVDLPPAFGRIRLTGRVVWSEVRVSEQTVEGERRRHYQSGIEFVALTEEQQITLEAALEMFAVRYPDDAPPAGNPSPHDVS